MTTRWCPPLPTIGRGGPRINVAPSATLIQKLDDYYCEFRSVSDLFERRISPSFLKTALRGWKYGPTYLSDLSPGQQQSVLLRNLYFKISAASRSKLRRELDAGNLHHVRSWFHTANAVVFPLLISRDVEPEYYEIDTLVSWVLENCAHNYALFQASLKKTKKQIRKVFALTQDLSKVKCDRLCLPYLNAMKRSVGEFDSPESFGRFILLWTQTRATGMANNKMLADSLEKFKSTVSDPGVPHRLDPESLRQVTTCMTGVNLRTAKISVGTTSCLESTRAAGGKTALLSKLSRRKCLVRRYNFETLESVEVEPQPVRTSEDVLHWAVNQVLHYPTYASCVRLHVVSEPSKARTISVAPYAYQVIMGVFAHIFQPCLRDKRIRSGMKADRHLWRFLQESLNPQSRDWDALIEEIGGQGVFVEHPDLHYLSTDLSEATDWGNKDVARQIWQALIEAANVPGFPLGLAVLAKTLYCRKRFCFVPNGSNQFELTIGRRGWLMGDMMTKVILTLAHQYCCVHSRLTTYNLVGDDEIALSSKVKLEAHLNGELSKIFKISELDTYISSFFAFYCEEGAIMPKSARQSLQLKMKVGAELNYLDYPRFRLLLPQIIETDSYSMTNIGRFSLLGKETRWVHQVNPKAAHYFDVATLLQHILVPQEKDTLCPFTPIEIGGDGAWPRSARFLHRVVEDKCFNPRETKYRLTQLLNNKFGSKFVRTDRTDKVVHKHHLYLPKMEGLESILPKDAILRPQDQNSRVMLQSMSFDEIATPESIFFSLAKGLYYQDLLQGRTPIEPTFNLERAFTDGHTTELTVEYDLFLETWRNPGFKFNASYDYWVYRSRVPQLNPMSLGWTTDVVSYPGKRQILSDWEKENLSLREQSVPDIISMIVDRKPLPPRVVDVLNTMLESDTYIMHVLDPDQIKGPDMGIVTRDIRLCTRVRNYLARCNKHILVFAIDPLLYAAARVTDIKTMSGADTSLLNIIEDPGSMLYTEYNELSREDLDIDGLISAPVKTRLHRKSGISVAYLDFQI
jgi:hypothetical protein